MGDIAQILFSPTGYRFFLCPETLRKGNVLEKPMNYALENVRRVSEEDLLCRIGG